ncbi:putative molybdopterin binding protein [Paraburkholderia sp. BL23I1N1]|nr:putative molybdopterin binding protein [Paraburkholderia sp. BL23I1N1]
MAFGVIIIGDEILSGRRVDKHLPKVIELLGARGLSLGWAEYIGDEPARITATLRRTFASGDIVFSTGGIGATPDDHTRQCAAAALGVPLELHPEAAKLIQERIRDMYPANLAAPLDLDSPENRHRLNMGTYPQGASIIPNGYNKIPGFSINQHHFVPGFPVMAWPMIEWVLDTQYAHFASRDAACGKVIAGVRAAGVARDAVDGKNRTRFSGREGVQPAERGGCGARRRVCAASHRSRREGRTGSRRGGVCEAARRGASVRRRYCRA